MIRAICLSLCVAAAVVASGCNQEVSEVAAPEGATPQMTEEEKQKQVEREAEHARKAAEERDKAKKAKKKK